MTIQGAPAVNQRFLTSGDEAGTAPDDRRFRPDVEGLRAVAVLLVVLYHANVPRLTGGYVGVDVFFVISGFVITGVLLRERSSTDRTSILDFYARRCRRILPAATVVILATVAASYAALGYVRADGVANDGRWAAVFLSNFHFEAVGTNYFTATQPPSPLQNYWSLSVEEQFYVVYPTLFLLVANLKARVSLRARMAVLLAVVIIVSYSLSIAQTASSPTAAYFSPFTRAWELALGALVAVGTSWLKSVPARLATLLTWSGLAAIMVSAFAFNATKTAYPGSLVAIPVVGAALVIGGGVVVSNSGAEWLLGLRPFQWLGKRSYSLYLWHWPILIIVAEHYGKSTLPLGVNLILVLVALALSMATYRLVENPIRHLRRPSKPTVAAGIALILVTVGILSIAITTQTPAQAATRVVPAANTQAVLRTVAAAVKITTVPKSLQPSLSQAAGDYGGNHEGQQCQSSSTQSSERLCVLGDPRGRNLMVLYGDSHALMWLQAFDGLAKTAHWRLVVLGKHSCPAEPVTVANPPGVGEKGGPYVACDSWHVWAMRTINRLRPNMVVVTSQDARVRVGKPSRPPVSISSQAWHDSIIKLFADITVPGVQKVLLGNIPILRQSGPECVSAHPDNVQKCSAPTASSLVKADTVERSTVALLHVRYVDPTPWLCSKICSPVIGHYDVYLDRWHLTSTYAAYLQNALAQSLGI